jgi:hypothetical protein
MDERVRIQFRVRSEVAEAFIKACTQLDHLPGEELEKCMEAFVRDRIKDRVVASIDEGRGGQVQEEVFRVDILCDDPLCITPRIVMDGSAGEEQTGERETEERNS